MNYKLFIKNAFIRFFRELSLNVTHKLKKEPKRVISRSMGIRFVYITFLGIGLVGCTAHAFSQIGTNPVNPTNNDAFQSNQKPRFKGDSGSVKKVYTSKGIRQITERDLERDSLVLHTIDTSIVGKERYSPLLLYNDYRINTGGLGLPQRALIPEFSNPVGFNNGQNILSIYLLQPENLEYYRSKSPYSELAFLTGGKKEQWFRLVHSQNINPRFAAGLQYYRVGSKGFYPRQKVDNLNLAFLTWYQSKNYRYNQISNLVFNSLNSNENGGVQNDSLFKVSSPITHEFQNIILSNAQTSWNQFDFYTKHIYSIGHLDSIPEKAYKSMKIYPLLQVKYTLHYKLSKYNYDDVLGLNNTYYPNILIDTANTHDNIRQGTLENEFGVNLFGHGNFKKDGHFSLSGAHLNASIKDQIIHYQQNRLIDTSLNNIILHANLAYNLSNRFSLEINGDYNIIGSNHFDNFIEARAILGFGEFGNLKGKISTETHQPDFIFDKFSSNSYQWNFRYSKMKIQKILGAYENDFLHFKASAELNLIDGYTYFAGAANQLVFPTQFQNQIRIFRVRFDKEFTYHHFGLLLYGIYQQNSQPLIIRTPELYGYASLYYQKTIFQVLRLRTGLEGTYFSKAYLYDYAPGLGQFFVYTNAQYGNTPVINAFLVAGLKRVRMTLKYDYLNQGHPQLGYYTIHNYPAPDAVIKFGVSWKFYD